jgi:hypothetical protein
MIKASNKNKPCSKESKCLATFDGSGGYPSESKRAKSIFENYQ